MMLLFHTTIERQKNEEYLKLELTLNQKNTVSTAEESRSLPISSARKPLASSSFYCITAY